MQDTIPIGPIAQVAATYFSGIAFLSHGIYRSRFKSYLDSTNLDSNPSQYPFSFLWLNIYHPSWMLSYFCAVLFHTKETKLTERLDYFCALLSLIVCLYITIVRIFWVVKTAYRILIAIPFGLYFSWHCWTMHYVLFDYGWHMKVGMAMGLFNTFMWKIYLIGTQKPHTVQWFIFFFAVIAGVQLEIYDLDVYFGYYDSHALWHGIAPFIGLTFHHFMIQDAYYFLERKSTKDL